MPVFGRADAGVLTYAIADASFQSSLQSILCTAVGARVVITSVTYGGVMRASASHSQLPLSSPSSSPSPPLGSGGSSSDASNPLGSMTVVVAVSAGAGVLVLAVGVSVLYLVRVRAAREEALLGGKGKGRDKDRDKDRSKGKGDRDSSRRRPRKPSDGGSDVSSMRGSRLHRRLGLGLPIRHPDSHRQRLEQELEALVVGMMSPTMTPPRPSSHGVMSPTAALQMALAGGVVGGHTNVRRLSSSGADDRIRNASYVTVPSVVRADGSIGVMDRRTSRRMSQGSWPRSSKIVPMNSDSASMPRDDVVQ